MWTPDELDQLRSALRTWYRTHARPLPWRTQPSLYRTVVSEFMCQQTQVETVLPYFHRWMRKFPDFAALAAAPEETVLKAWEGLGYYNRARNLQRLARKVVDLDRLPSTPAEWQALPGVGPYTAAAISSIANGYPAAVVDGNVIRVLARLTADSRAYDGNSAAVRAFQPLASALLDPDSPGDHNQAMMELGATVCLKARPACLLCPVRFVCAASRSGEPERFPVIVRRATENLTVPRLFAFDGNRLLLERAPEGARRLAKLAELPRAERFPASLRGPVVFTGRRGISNQRITEPIHAACWPDDEASAAATLHPHLFWQPTDRLDQITLSGPHRRWITQLLRTPATG